MKITVNIIHKKKNVDEKSIRHANRTIQSEENLFEYLRGEEENRESK